ncbi:MAG: hypothetical protein M1386_05305, partial [Candidatus Thermoplasmatota archaeon]|nr:hypothetical protein [Candidatus Thermoplasmatota archaeon]
LFLMKYMHSKKIKNLSYLVEKTLRNMRNGGIYDQVGYGLHRYSTDSEWKIPHFEKMLYDQAMAIEAYTQYYRFSGDNSFLEVAGEIVEFVNREMKNPDGFYDSGLDADFEGNEGYYYTWTDDELKEEFDEETRKKIEESYYFDRDMENRIVLRRRELFNVSRDKVKSLKELNGIILKVRNERGTPKKDDKAILAWNAMLLSSMLSYSISMQMKGIDEIVDTSRRLMKSFSSGSKLYRTVRKGSKGVEALLEDYAYYISLMLDLYEATGEKEFLSEALEKMNKVNEKFLDKMEGGFYSSPEGELKTITRNKDRLDIIYPSGESVLYDVLERLFLITGAEEFREFADSIFHSRRNEMLRNPLSSVYLLSSLVSKGKEMKIEIPDKLRKDLLSEIGRRSIPNVLVVPGFEFIQICDDKSCKFKGNDLKEAIDFITKGN